MIRNLRKKMCIFTLVASILGSNIAVQSSFAQSTDEDIFKSKITELNKKKSDFKKGEIIVKYKSPNNLAGKKYRIKSKINKICSSNSSSMAVNKKILADDMELISIDPNADVEAVSKALCDDSDVAYAQPNYIYYTNYIPQDPKFSEQWSFQNTADGIDINATKAWDINKGSSSVVVAVLDTGVDINHPDLRNNIDIADAWDFVNNDNTVFHSKQEDSHGTHVTGIIAAINNTVGVVGVAPNVRILPLKISNGVDITSDCAISAINYAKSKGATIANCSWGWYYDHDQALYDTIANSPEMLFTVAAGNDSADVSIVKCNPASFDLPNILTVAAIDSKGNLASFSNYGAGVDVAAPGVNILSTIPKKDTDTVYDGDEYGLYYGTSQAAPHVAGVAALIKSQYPSSTVSDIIQKIKSGAIVDESIKDKVPGGLVVDTYNSIKSAPSIVFTSSKSTENRIYLQWNAIANATEYQITVNNSIPFSSSTTSTTISSLQPGTNYIVKVVAKNSSGQVLAENRIMKKTIWAGTGVGLKGQYYNDATMNSLKLTKTENINFNWGTGSPDSTIPNTTFSAKWQGEVEAKYSEEFTFYAQTQGATKLWVNGQLICNKAYDDTDTIQELYGKINLIAGKTYSIQLEYCETFSSASIKLLWSSASQTKEIIPANRLLPFVDCTGTWSILEQGTVHTACNYCHSVVESGKLYNVVSDVFGKPRIEVFDDAQNKFIKLCNTPHKIYLAVASLNNKIYCFRSDPNTKNLCIDEYDISAAKWTDKCVTNFALGLNSAITVNGKIYVFGAGTNMAVRTYNPTTNTFTIIAQMPDSRDEYSLTELNGNIYLTGGIVNKTIRATGYVFNTQNYSWTPIKNMPVIRSNHGSFSLNGKIFIVGGYSTNGDATSQVDMYDPISNTWYPRTNYFIPRTNMGLALYKGKVYSSYGGYGPGSYLNYDIFTPNPAKP